MSYRELIRGCDNAAFTARYIDLHDMKRFANLHLQTCIAPSTFVIGPCALHSAIHVRNLSVRTA